MPFTSAARSKRRCAPVNSASTRSASARGTSTASRAASAHAAFSRLCSPGTASLKSTGSRSRPQITVSIPPAQVSNASASSASEPKVVWWSSSTFVTTATVAGSAKTLLSDSSPSTTSQPLPALALPPSCGISPPMRNDGSRPSRSSTKAIIAVVVVLPCAPATTMESARPTSSARSSARGAPSTRPAKAVETKASASAGASGGPSEISTGIPAARTPSRYGVSRRSQPLTSAPHALARIP